MFNEPAQPALDNDEGSSPSAPEAEPASSGVLSRFDADNLFDERDNEMDKDTRIIGGSQASDGEFPYSVSMQDHIGHFCGGSLIAPNIVLTAA